MKKEILCLCLLATLMVGCGGGEKAKEPIAKPEESIIPEIKKSFDLNAAWPLCGRITDNKPNQWIETDGCPEERWGEDFTDEPFSSTYGPRKKASSAFRYDFHRGLDIPTPKDTPLFAISDGTIMIAGESSVYSNKLIQIRHYKNGENSCEKGCYYSNYMHLSKWVVSEGDVVKKGELIGYSGESVNGSEHLHFEIRNTLNDESAWTRDLIHPLIVLPYHDKSAENIHLSLEVNTENLMHPLIKVKVVMPNTQELDLNKIEVNIYKKEHNTLTLVEQEIYSGAKTPENEPYEVNPSSYDMMKLNRQYSYKDSYTYPWESFMSGGEYESPYALELPATYDDTVHLDKATAEDKTIGEFNGCIIDPSRFSTASDNYELTLTFTELKGIESGEMCVKAIAYDILGNKTSTVSDNC